MTALAAITIELARADPAGRVAIEGGVVVKAICLSSLAAAAASILLLAGPASAQSSSEVPDRFRLEIGGFQIGSDTKLTFDTSGGQLPPVDFEDLNVPESQANFYVEAFWRPGRRHQLSLSWFGNKRDGDPKTVERDFNWGDQVIHAGATINAHADSDYFSGVYRFAAYKNDTFEIGPALGIGFLSLEAGIRGELTASGSSSTFDRSRSLDQPTGDIGGYLYWWPIPRLLIRGDMRYIIVKPGDAEASVTDGRVGAIYHFTRSFGVGLQYVYTKFRYDREIFSSELGGSLRYSGGQVVIAGAF
jgi:hypothetical protein